MMTPRYSWTQPCCATCWEDQHPGLVPVRMRSQVAEVELCVFCAAANLDGIYLRIDPAEAPHPSIMKD